MLTRKKSVGILVRLKPEIEELVRMVSEETGYARYTVRNLAVLYGLVQVLLLPRLPRDDYEFIETYEKIRRILEGVIDYA